MTKYFPYFLIIYHLLFAYIAYDYVSINNGDAFNYWFTGQDLDAVHWVDFLKPGTDVVKFFTFPLVKYFHLPFWSGFFIFSLFGGFGILVMYRLMNEIAGNSNVSKILIFFLLLLPNLHFWTSVIGKEAPVFVFLVIVLYEVYRKKYYSFLLIFSLLMIAVIRPHVAFVVMVSYVAGLLCTVNITARKKIILLGGFTFFTGIFTFMLTQLQDFSGGFQRIIRKYEAHINHFKTTDGYVPLDEYSLPYKIFTFYFRPFPFEKEGIFYQIISLENIVFLLLFGIVLFYSVKYFRVLKKELLFVFPLIMLLLFSVMYVYAYANYGIIMRTKIMAVPFILVITMQVIKISGKFGGENFDVIKQKE